MTAIAGLQGLRPASAAAAHRLVAPPYDVIKPGSRLEAHLKGNPDNLWQVTLGPDPLAALARLQASGAVVEDGEAAFYVTEQVWAGGRRVGVFAGVAVSHYREKQVVRHEKVFDDKVQGRLRLTKQTGLTLEPIFLLTRAAITPVLENILDGQPPLWVLTPDFAGENEMHGLRTRVVRVPAASAAGRTLQALVGQHPLYIADGHHRYHAALLGRQTHAMAYIVEKAGIQAYNRVIRGVRPFSEIIGRLALQPAASFATPPRHAFAIYHAGKAWTLPAQTVPQDVVGRLDVSILERELYPLLGLEHRMIKDPRHFDYYPEQDLARMQAVVDAGDYDLAVALHPVSIDDLIAVADAGLADPEIVMPEKSTFFAPKILSGLLLYRHRLQA